MYEINNDYSIYVYIRPKNVIVQLNNEDELIYLLATYFHDLRAWGFGIINSVFEFSAWDSYGRNINLYDYKDESFNFYLKHFSDKPYRPANVVAVSPICAKGKPKFRQEPVPYTGKNCYHWFSKGSDRHSKVGHLVKMYKNPEYKQFNRPMKNRSFKDWREPQRNWKSQRRHQYKNEQVL